MPGEGGCVISDAVCPDGLSNGEEATSIGEDQSSSASSDGGTSYTDYFACPMEVANVPLAMDRDIV